MEKIAQEAFIDELQKIAQYVEEQRGMSAGQVAGTVGHTIAGGVAGLGAGTVGGAMYVAKRANTTKPVGIDKAIFGGKHMDYAKKEMARSRRLTFSPESAKRYFRAAKASGAYKTIGKKVGLLGLAGAAVMGGRKYLQNRANPQGSVKS